MVFIASEISQHCLIVFSINVANYCVVLPVIIAQIVSLALALPGSDKDCFSSVVLEFNEYRAGLH